MARYAFEQVPEDERYYFLVGWREYNPGGDTGLSEESVFRPSAGELEEIEAQDRRRREVGYIGAVTDDLFGDHAAVYEEGSRPWLVPALYTQRHHAEEARKQVEKRDPEAYLGLVAKHGEEITNRAYDNAAPLRVVWTDRDALMEWLPDTAFPAVMVDNEFKLPGNLWGELTAERGE